MMVENWYTAGYEHGRIEEVAETLKLLEQIYKILRDNRRSATTAHIILSRTIAAYRFYLTTNQRE